MSEVQGETVAGVGEVVQGDPADLGDAGKKALKAERDKARELEKLVKSLQEQVSAAETAQITDLERAQQAAREATERLAEVQRTVLRQQVALQKGVPATLVERLRGDDEASLSADADELLALLNKPTSPKPDPSQGAKGALPLNGDGLEMALRQKLGI